MAVFCRFAGVGMPLAVPWLSQNQVEPNFETNIPKPDCVGRSEMACNVRYRACGVEAWIRNRARP